MKIATLAIASALALFQPTVEVPAPASAAAEVKLWRIDCGRIDFADFGPFSDSGDYKGKPHTVVASCYLIRHGDEYLLWDTGLNGALVGNPMTSGGNKVMLDERIVTQIARLGVKPEQVRYVGISHHHFDHIGQALDFPGATLLIGQPDFDRLSKSTTLSEREGLMPWLTLASKSLPLTGDHDVFGDGSVTMISLPGHTPGHYALLVRVTGGPPLLLSGDQFHAQESFDKNLVPIFNADRAQTLVSSDRFRGLAAKEKAVIVIQHEPADIAKVPAIPKAK
ncbi:N-acyl homoserine lactonase family protein [Sphingomonas sp. AOB5]|uniref:N-acyl homoserine lactonase family protein n=1 Tax=Sphingomonas sp. AOB5 TaxID=3034017 RepID=UPI0023F92209|nr:N-acyl homoserine lactonase family protein [Sphingomonas sp. AOB5]MDF7775218.1 N-acyl homoserine lactonase family protein [Sphingomonas sp. AOB5]